jgi:CheY-like chemotaxis protein
MLGYPSVRAANGADALARLESMPRPGLILLDLMMPVMDGWAFAEATDRNPRFADIPIIVITAFSDRAHTLRKARRVLPKPVDLDVLIDAIRPYCG